jgi:hypothetical protein
MVGKAGDTNNRLRLSCVASVGGVSVEADARMGEGHRPPNRPCTTLRYARAPVVGGASGRALSYLRLPLANLARRIANSGGCVPPQPTCGMRHVCPVPGGSPVRQRTALHSRSPSVCTARGKGGGKETVSVVVRSWCVEVCSGCRRQSCGDGWRFAHVSSCTCAVGRLERVIAKSETLSLGCRIKSRNQQVRGTDISAAETVMPSCGGFSTGG